DGARIHRVEAPPTEGPGRERGREALMTFLRAAARGRRRVNFDITLLCGDGTYRTIKVGGRDGYDARRALRDSRAEGNDRLAWLKQETDAVIEANYLKEWFGTIVVVVLRVWGKSRS